MHCALDRTPTLVPVGRPRAIVLDVNETLFSLRVLDPLFDRWGFTGQRDLWFARVLRTGFALTCAGEYRGFPEVARGALRGMDPERMGAEETDALIEAFAALEPYPEVEPALRRLQDNGIPMVTLSVGNAANVARLFERSGLAELVDTHLSCEDVRRWKPAPEPYLHACRVLGFDASEVCMVAVHSWDIGGAAAAGLQTAWVSRLEGIFDANFGEPDVIGADLVAVVERLLS